MSTLQHKANERYKEYGFTLEALAADLAYQRTCLDALATRLTVIQLKQAAIRQRQEQQRLQIRQRIT